MAITRLQILLQQLDHTLTGGYKITHEYPSTYFEWYSGRYKGKLRLSGKGTLLLLSDPVQILLKLNCSKKIQKNWETADARHMVTHMVGLMKEKMEGAKCR